MSEFTLLSGEVSQLNQLSSTTGSINKGSGTIRTAHHLTFRLGNKPVRYSGTPSINDGDIVTVMGEDKGEFEAYVLRNESTGIIYNGNRKEGSRSIA